MGILELELVPTIEISFIQVIIQEVLLGTMQVIIQDL